MDFNNPQELVGWITSPGLSEQVHEFEKNFKWVMEHRSELEANYPDQWVVVLEQEVIGSGNNLESLILVLKVQGFDLYCAHTVFLDSKPLILYQN